MCASAESSRTRSMLMFARPTLGFIIGWASFCNKGFIPWGLRIRGILQFAAGLSWRGHSSGSAIAASAGPQRGSGDEELAFGGLDRFQFHIVIVLASLIDLGSQIIGFSSLRLESHSRTDALGRFLEGTRLPIGAHLMIAGIHGKEKIRFTLVGSDPRAIEPNLHRGAAFNVLEHIDECLASIRGCDWVLLAVCLYVEIRVAGAAATAGRSRRRRFLRKSGRSNNRKQNA